MTSAAKAAAGRLNPAILAAIDWALAPDENRRPKSVDEFRKALTAPTPIVLPTPALSAPITRTLKVLDSKPAQQPAGSDKKAWWKLGK